MRKYPCIKCKSTSENYCGTYAPIFSLIHEDTVKYDVICLDCKHEYQELFSLSGTQEREDDKLHL